MILYLLYTEPSRLITFMTRTKLMTDYQNDILVGAFFISGIFALLAGVLIISVALFTGTAYFSTAHLGLQLES
ncbi:MAG: hypothetical protein DRQ62_08095 [Gammaproteobacteria bacterium]|nr:MAG: hypothetical protein DRQ62_08095 [Gammaproteobacteria bacterium]